MADTSTTTDQEEAPTATPPHSPWYHHVCAWCLGLLFGGMRRAPAWLAYGLADIATPFIVMVSVFEQKIARPKTRGVYRNQRIVFRDQLTPRLRRRLYWQWARHMGWLFVDFCRMPRITRANVERYFDLTEFPPLLRLLEAERGVIFVTGHIGCFELCGHLGGVYDYPLRSVMRPIPMRPVNDLIASIRRHAGQLPMSKFGVVWPLKKALERSLPVGLVADENTKQRAIFAPFLGTAAATSSTPALLHRWTRAPLVVVTCMRESRERYKIRVWDIIENEPTDDEEADLEATTRRINAGLTQAIVEYPEQWFWESRRFRTRPEGEVLLPEGLPPLPSPDAGGLTAEQRAAALARLG